MSLLERMNKCVIDTREQHQRALATRKTYLHTLKEGFYKILIKDHEFEIQNKPKTAGNIGPVINKQDVEVSGYPTSSYVEISISVPYDLPADDIFYRRKCGGKHQLSSKERLRLRDDNLEEIVGKVLEITKHGILRTKEYKEVE